MAELLKREYDIVVLKIELRYITKHVAEVSFTFQYHCDDQLVDDGHWVVPINFSESETSDSRNGNTLRKGHLDAWQKFDLPDGMMAHIRQWIEQERRDGAPLWVHLVKPYGPLRLVYWEKVFHRELRVPVLMLPDFIFPRPREDDSILEVAVCASRPQAGLESDTEAYVAAVIGSINAGPNKQVKIHLFADQDILSRLPAFPSASSKHVIVYDVGSSYGRMPDRARAQFDADDGALRSPWLKWMAATLTASSIDVVHFICHGHLADDRGSLLLAASPSPSNSVCEANRVGRTELKTFLTQIGAWSSVFTSLPGNKSNFGLRVIADDIAQSRPGPLMLHYLSRDVEGHSLQHGYDFLYGRLASTPPMSDALLIYCQPYLVAGAESSSESLGAYRFSAAKAFSRNMQQRSSIDRAMAPSPVMDYLFSQGEVTQLVSSTERFAEQTRLGYQQLNRDELLESASGKRSMEIALDTVHRLQMAVAAHTVPSLKLESAMKLSELLTSDGSLGRSVADRERTDGVTAFLSKSQLAKLKSGWTP